jgi:hypothetical protein
MIAYNKAIGRGKGQVLLLDSVKSQLRYNFNEVINPADLGL